MTEDFTSGFALTVDSFCTGGEVGRNLIRYDEMQTISANNEGDSCTIYVLRVNEIAFNSWGNEPCQKLFGDNYSDTYGLIARFLKAMKNF